MCIEPAEARNKERRYQENKNPYFFDMFKYLKGWSVFCCRKNILLTEFIHVGKAMH